jgi:hypothetical protein
MEILEYFVLDEKRCTFGNKKYVLSTKALCTFISGKIRGIFNRISHYKFD